MYLVTAYRFGWTNYSRYMVYCGPDETKAHALASSECGDRGGKYGCEVVLVDADGTDYERVGYYPSLYGEDEPHNNYRMDYFESLGMRVDDWIQGGKALLPCADKPGTLTYQEVTTPPEWLVTEAKRQQEHHDMIERIYREVREKAASRTPSPGAAGGGR